MNKSILFLPFFMCSTFGYSAPNKTPLLPPQDAISKPCNINQLDNKALAKKMKGIGAKKASAIISYRNEHGPFQRFSDLESVPGLTQAMIKKYQQQWAEQICF